MEPRLLLMPRHRFPFDYDQHADYHLSHNTQQQRGQRWLGHPSRGRGLSMKPPGRRTTDLNTDFEALVNPTGRLSSFSSFGGHRADRSKNHPLTPTAVCARHGAVHSSGKDPTQRLSPLPARPIWREKGCAGTICSCGFTPKVRGLS